ncbi:transposase [Arcticibacter tournemirensis]|uniref:IS66 family insertion sequence element accessory protein TnpB n=1 Tax=Arcticibacter tournemirensis TaxID=699437 RepID=UPI001152DE9F|nr:IS66 family insertion sequence element accessory protein TnpB [Arcticibacter tournemirensis]TQM48546.1 transposase [Arcticibacter tournemirensis]TQM49610.1 transposase [Arcticibacter tournemirensis]
MLALSSACRYYFYQGITDFRCGFDALSGIVRSRLGQDPTTGDIFIFVNRKRSQIKLLHFEGDGFALYHKRLESGNFEVPQATDGTKHTTISSDELMLILKGINLKSVQRRKRFSMKKIA